MTFNKYRAKKTIVDGIKFDSKGEAKRYLELKALESAGKIKNLKLQVPFELQPSFKKNKKNYSAVKYVADFTYFDEMGNYTIEDFKGVETPVFKLKRKLFEYKYKESIRIVK